MSNHSALLTVEHRNLRIRTERSAALGDGAMCGVTFPAEFRRVQNHYPILFQLSPERDSFTALALFGFQNGENLFLKDGRWDARYRPLAIDIQPFLIGQPLTSGGEKQIHIDLDSPRISTDEGMRVFDDAGNPTPFLEDISEKLGALDAGYQGSAAYLEALRKYDLLEPFSLEIELNDGSKNRLVGFHTIDEDRVRALDAAALGALHAAGHLFPTFMVLASLANLGARVDRKNNLDAHG